ncbi:unnamed protein product, partial [Discosporangium mesarthrocarpum]
MGMCGSRSLAIDVLDGAKWGNTEQVESFIRQGGNVNTTDNDELGRTPLHWACVNGHYEVVKVLLCSGGANINVADRDRNLPLHHAAEQGHAHLCRLLISGGANVNAQNDLCRTALHIPCREGFEEVCRVLLDAGADYEDLRDRFGQTPRDMAAEEIRVMFGDYQTGLRKRNKRLMSQSKLPMVGPHDTVPVTAGTVGTTKDKKILTAAGLEAALRVLEVEQKAIPGVSKGSLPMVRVTVDDSQAGSTGPVTITPSVAQWPMAVGLPLGEEDHPVVTPLSGQPATAQVLPESPAAEPPPATMAALDTSAIDAASMRAVMEGGLRRHPSNTTLSRSSSRTGCSWASRQCSGASSWTIELG